MKLTSQIDATPRSVRMLDSTRGDETRFYRRLTIALCMVILAGAIVGIIVPAGSGWDFANFFDTGRRMAAGQVLDLYRPDSLIAGEQPQGKLGFYGAPISALLYMPLSLFSPAWALIAFKVQNTIAYFAALGLLYWHNRQFAENSSTGQWKFAALFAALCLLFQPLWTVYRVGGQTTPTVFLLFALALTLHTRSRLLGSALCMVAAVIIKPAFIFALIFLACASGWRFIRHVAVLSAVAGLASLLIMGWGVHQEFLRMMAYGNQTSYPWFYNSSVYVIGENLKLLGEGVGQSAFLRIAAITVKLGALVLCVWVLWRSRAANLTEKARRHFDFLAAIAFCLLISQTVWEHYLTVLFPMLAYIAASHRRFTRPALILAGAIFVSAAWQNLIVINFLRANITLDTAAGLILMGICKSAPIWLTAVFLGRHHKEMFRSYGVQAW